MTPEELRELAASLNDEMSRLALLSASDEIERLQSALEHCAVAANDPRSCAAYALENERLQMELNEIKSEVVEYVHDGGEFNWAEAMVWIRHWRERAEALEAT